MYASSDDEKYMFYMALGIAVDKWQSVDMMLQKLFARLVSGDYDSIAAAAAYYAIVGFKGRLDMTKYAARVRLTPTEYKRCAKLLSETETLSGDRNRFAHSYVMQGPVDKDGLRFYLAPMPLDPNYSEHYAKPLGIRAKKTRRYNLKELESVSNEFYDLARRLFAYATTVKLAKIKRPSTLRRLRLPKRPRP